MSTDSNKPTARVEATMVFNSLTHASIAGFRGAAESQQIVFQSENLSLHIRVSKANDERIILGQLLQRGPGGFVSHAAVSLVAASQNTQEAVTNSIGEFRFAGVPDGGITIEVEVPSKQRLIANFKVIGD